MKKLTEDERIAYLQREVVYQALREIIVRDEAVEEEDRVRAKQWIFGDAEGLGSFLWACEVGGLDPETLRNVLRERGKA